MSYYLQLVLVLLCSFLCAFYTPLISQEIDQEIIPSDSVSNHHNFEEELDWSLKQHKEKREEGINTSPTSYTSQVELTLSAECEPLTTIAGCVNICSGHFFQVEQDLISNTIDPLSFVRSYDSGNNSESFLGYGFGSAFPLWASNILKSVRHHYVMISEREGFMLPYRDKEGGPSKICWIDPRILKKGYTNLSRTAMRGRANFVNWKAIYQETQHHPDGKWSVLLGDGAKRTYSKYVKLKHEHQRRMDFPTDKAYLLEEEIKPNGNKLLFFYNIIHEKPRLVKVQAMNRTGSVLLDELHFTYAPHHCTVTTRDGESVEYALKEEACLSDHLASGKLSISITKEIF